MKSVMKQTSCLFIALIILLFGIIGCGQKTSDLTTLIDTLKGESMQHRQKAFVELHAMGKKAIPDLIEAIDDNDTTFIFLQNPTSSNFEQGALTNYAGLLPAYVIELILARDKLKVSGQGDSLWVFSTDPQNYIYDSGIIAKKVGGPLTYRDMKKIAEIYRTWWKQNKNRSIEGLRDEWKTNVRPLTGSDYFWK
jgi:hypothetical protein